jgi:hypothetical protein
MADVTLQRDPQEFGTELADRVVRQIQIDGVSADEATAHSASEVAFCANELTASGLPRGEVRVWIQEVKAAFRERLHEWLIETLEGAAK